MSIHPLRDRRAHLRFAAHEIEMRRSPGRPS